MNCAYVSHCCPPASLGLAVLCEARVASSAGSCTVADIAQERKKLSWPDCREGAGNAHHSDFRHNTSKEVPWVKGPGWLDLALRNDDRSVSEARHGGNPKVPEIASSRFEVGEPREAVEALELLVHRGCHIYDSLFYRVLKRCIGQKNLVLGRRVHSLAVRCGYGSNAFLANHIIGMYAAHGKLLEATEVFDKVAVPNAHMWASIILAHARHAQPKEAIQFYRRMRASTMNPDNHIFVAVLKACATAQDLASGKEIHADIMRSKVECNIFVGNCLVDMYAKCGSLEDARIVFDGLPIRDVVTWNAIIAGYAQHGLGQEALALYASMQLEGSIPANHVTFVCLLQACASFGALHQGKQLHKHIEERGLEDDVVVGSSLVDMYAKCGSLQDARRVFDKLSTRDVVTWTAMIGGYVHHGFSQEALALYASMQQEGMSPANHVTFVCLLQACASVGALHQGTRLHAQIRESGLESHMAVGNCLVDLYAKCGRLEESRRLFSRLPSRDVVTWTALLNGYAQQGEGRTAIQCFEEMRQQGVEPNPTTFICLLVACSHEGLVDEGHQFLRLMVEEYAIVPTMHHHMCMVDLLGRAGRLHEAECMLKTTALENDIVGWTSLLSACKSHGDHKRGRRCFNHLVELEPENAAPYVLLGNLYASVGRWRDVNRIENLRKAAGAKKKPGKACIEVQNKVHEFTVGEDRADVSATLTSTNLRVKEEGGHVPHTELVLNAVPQREKEDALCGHAEKLALAYGLLNTPDGTTLLVTKNLRMCNDCHSSTKIMSRLEKREIVVRDAHRVHCFTNGFCSCRDRH